MVCIGGAKEEVGAVLIARPKGMDALKDILRKLAITPGDIETACRVLTTQPSHLIPEVLLSPSVIRRLGL